MQNTSIDRFTEDDILTSFPEGTGQRGLASFKRGDVIETSVEVGNGELRGRVLGKRGEIHNTEIEIDWTRGEPEFFSSCTCRDEFDCLHAAALLFYAVKKPYLLDALVDSAENEVEHAPASTMNITMAPAWPHHLDQANNGHRLQLPDHLSTWLQKASSLLGQPDSYGVDHEDELFYILDSREVNGRTRPDLQPLLVRRLQNGRRCKTETVGFELLAARRFNHATADEDAGIGAIFSGCKLAALMRQAEWAGVPDDSGLATMVLGRIVNSGRCHWQSIDNPALTSGPLLTARLDWELLPDGRQKPRLEFERENLLLLWCSSPWYVDQQTWESGPVELPMSLELVDLFLSIPPLEKEHSALFWSHLKAKNPTHEFPAPRLDTKIEVVCLPPTPCLYLLRTVSASGPSQGQVCPAALLSFDYGAARFSMTSDDEEVQRREKDRVVVMRRHLAAEQEARRRMVELDFQPAKLAQEMPGVTAWIPVHPDHADLICFLEEDLPALREEGWRIEIAPDFPCQIVEPKGAWSAAISRVGSESGWFSVELGITVDGKRYSLLKLLEALFGMLPGDNMLDAIDLYKINGKIHLPLPDGAHVALPAERVRAIVAVLIELFDGSNSEGRVAVPQVLSLLRQDPHIEPTWAQGAERLKQLWQRLKGFSGVSEVKAPPALNTQLRDYQLQGLSWLQFLREFELGGILADDMGLGKTVQALSHILLEKEQGRLANPSLVICPTSVIPNWIAEAARFAPSLRLLRLHGGSRSRLLDDIQACDLVVTSYSLVARDAEHLLNQEWHAVILDEAQMIKNHTTKVAQTVFKLRSNHRVCLTGTPVENHLGELWSQFNFLMPGALGDYKTFGRLFRKPIEKYNNTGRQEVLAARLRPFMLRRTKEQVAPELPEKSTIIRRIELEGDQCDLYEAIRTAMHGKIQAAISAKGLNQCQIIILDALLKLRQVCCDPRLVKLDEARDVKSSAKLDALMSMLPDLVEEGRRVLLFSQFTSMLDLIEQECTKVGIRFVKLRGDTLDRETPVRTFQSGEVPLFLISLKAGGKGINLTAADTVIHYDPWWNPAAEDQATDRAYRIGQDKNVFVYKLIAAGTVEERMLHLQERKRALAESVFARRSTDKLHFDESDLALLFSPLGVDL